MRTLEIKSAKKQTATSRWALQLKSGTYYFETKTEAEELLEEKRGEFILYVKGNGRWVKKRKGYLM